MRIDLELSFSDKPSPEQEPSYLIPNLVPGYESLQHNFQQEDNVTFLINYKRQ